MERHAFTEGDTRIDTGVLNGDYHYESTCVCGYLAKGETRLALKDVKRAHYIRVTHARRDQMTRGLPR